LIPPRAARDAFVMLEIRKLRKAIKPCTPIDMLDHLIASIGSLQLPDDFREPLLSIHLKSGTTYKGNVLGETGDGVNEPKCYAFSLMIEHEADEARDILYVKGDDIEAVVAWDVDDYAKLLPLNR
jgi:hypothetical protein